MSIKLLTLKKSLLDKENNKVTEKIIKFHYQLITFIGEKAKDKENY